MEMMLEVVDMEVDKVAAEVADMINPVTRVSDGMGGRLNLIL